MARTIAQIKQVMVDAKNAEPALATLNSPSATAKWNLIFYVVAVGIFVFENLMDIFKLEMEALALTNYPGTKAWLRAQVLKFQFSATDPQFIQLVNFTPKYTIEDASLRIITQCSVKQDANRKVLVKVAKGTVTLGPLAVDQKSALDAYLDKIQVAGTDVEAISLEADRLKLIMDIYYDPQYPATSVKPLIVTAVTDYLKNLDFDGRVEIIHLIDKLQTVVGVKDVVITEALGREEQEPITGSPSLFTRVYDTAAGYIIPEDTAGHTLNDTITMLEA